jgi:hypothetical protein
LTYIVAPVFQRLAAQHPQAVFAKVDVDAQQQIAATNQVTAMYLSDQLLIQAHIQILQGWEGG